MTIHNWRDTAAAAAACWRVLLSALGGCVLLMQAFATKLREVLSAG
jgi:hypothetical protein